MRRIRWYSCKWPVSFRAMVAKLRTREFSEESGSGFLVERARENRIEGRYVEKRVSENTVVDPFGGEQTSIYVEYRHVNFVLSTVFPEIQVWNSLKNVQSFASQLAELTNFTMSIAPVEVNAMKWGELFSQIVGISGGIIAVQAAGIQFEEGVEGKLFLKGADAQFALTRAIAGRHHTIERVVVHLRDGRKQIPVQFCADGTVILGKTCSDSIFEKVRESLTFASEKDAD